MEYFEHKFNIGDKIYHKTPESPQGIIVDISYLLSTGEVKYCVAQGFKDECWCVERELTKDKIII